MNRNVRLRVIFGAAVVLLVVIVAALGLNAVPGVDIPDSVRIVQAVVTIVAIAGGAIFAYYKLEIFRDFEPHLSISQNVSHRALGTKYVHISVTATLHNTSKVAIEVRKALFLLQRISPSTDEEIEKLYAEVFVDKSESYIQWRTEEKFECSWADDELIVEPGGAHSETCEFIIAREFKSVLIYSYFHNALYSDGSRATEGWDATSIYDIVKDKEDQF